MDTVTHTRKVGKTHPCQHEYTSQNHKTDMITAMFFFYSSGLFHLGNWFKLYQWRNVIFHRSTLGSQAATYFGRCPGWVFLLLSQKEEIWGFFFSLVFLGLTEIIVRPRARHLHQTSRMTNATVVCTVVLDAIHGFHFKYEQYIRFYSPYYTIMYSKEKNLGNCFSNALSMCLNEQNT